MDSGVGGLAVLKRFVREMPQSPYVFLGDTAWMPYGEKPLDVVRNRVKDVHQWLHTQYPLAAFVLACNTATVATYDVLEAMQLPYPVLEPVKTTAEWINAQVTPGQKIGILATPGTVSSGRYLNFLHAGWEVTQIPCTGLASIIESGVCSGPELDAILEPYLAPLRSWQADVLVLGCTHYSLIRDYIQSRMAPHVQIVDSAEVLAQVATPLIQGLNLGSGPQQMLVTGNAQHFSRALSQLPLQEFSEKTISPVSIGQAVPLH